LQVRQAEEAAIRQETKEEEDRLAKALAKELAAVERARKDAAAKEEAERTQAAAEQLEQLEQLVSQAGRVDAAMAAAAEELVDKAPIAGEAVTEAVCHHTLCRGHPAPILRRHLTYTLQLQSC